ncbi:MAG: hypothetical protein MUE96_07690 [Bacteroidia bacterium]|jgi:hypothetical protein|nr:hypothetical protein [Bacteroidia bacterium]
MVKIKAFRSTDNPQLCERFIKGHRRILDAIGVKKVTSSSEEWVTNPSSFVILVESSDESRVLGGARVQAADGKTPLPLEDAAGYMDEKVYELVRKYLPNGTGEVCGLWNSMEVAGMGIGSIFLIRAALALSEQIGLDTMFALCSPYTTRIAGNYGFMVEKSVGNDGKFYYPKLDLLATIVMQKDNKNLPNASELETSRIFDLRKKPIQIAQEIARKQQIVEIDYNLLLDSANPKEFKISPK